MDFLMGMITMFGFNWAPRSWHLCDGTLLSIAENQALFSLIGAQFGGDGRTTFALPDLRGRAPIGFGGGPGLTNHPFASRGGSETNRLTQQQMATHTHAATATATSTLYGENMPGDKAALNGKILASHAGAYKDPDPQDNVAMATEAVQTTVAVTVDPAGGSQPVNNMQPFLALNYSICVQGIYPSRS